MKLLVPILLALIGLGAGVGAGVFLKPKPQAADCVPAGAAEGEAAALAEGDPAETGAAPAAAECPPPVAGEEDPFAPVAQEKPKPDVELANVPIEKPFVVPIFDSEKIVAMVVVSLAVEIDAKAGPAVEAAEPRLRDSFLAAMFQHANTGGFNGTFTEGQKMDDLRAALLVAARKIFPDVEVNEVLITEIARQDV
jgi:hypothetical protein